MSSDTEPTSQTLHELVARQQRRDTPVNVHVVGNFDRLSPVGGDVAEKVANLVAGEDGEILTEDFEHLDDGDVAFVTIDEPLEESFEQRQNLQNLVSVARVQRLGGIVVFAEDVSAGLEHHLDARVWAVSGSVDSVERFYLDKYAGDVYTEPLGGLTNE